MVGGKGKVVPNHPENFREKHLGEGEIYIDNLGLEWIGSQNMTVDGNQKSGD